MGFAVDDEVMAIVDAESADEAAADFSGVDGLNADEEEAVAKEDGADEEKVDESTPAAVTMAPNSVLGGDDADADEEDEFGFDADDEADADEADDAPACVVRCPASAAATGNSEAASVRPVFVCAQIMDTTIKNGLVESENKFQFSTCTIVPALTHNNLYVDANFHVKYIAFHD